MTDFLLELRSEEIPARMQGRAREDLARLFAAELAAAGLTATETVTYATPRRLALIARGLPDRTEAVSEEVKGPKTSAPPQALDGFLRKTGLTREQLTERDGIYFAVTERPGRATADVLAAAIPAIVRAFPWPKAMRWGDASTSTESPRWVRPLHGIVALFGSDIVDCEAAGVRSGATTKGHRFHHPGDITISGAHDYVEKLRACHVVVDQDERAAIIATGATMLTAGAGLTLIRDEGLLAENAGLTEWPVPLLGRFDEAFLDVPPEVIQLTARVNQKYFVCNDGAGPDAKLANAFVCVANIDAADGGDKIFEGNRKVLAARLSDARFFYETDLKTKLEDQLPKLEKIVFHEKLGTVADKVDRVAKLARWLVEEGIVNPPQHGGVASRSDDGGAGEAQPSPSTGFAGPPPQIGEDRQGLADQAERAARLAKADLVTGMVGEFPELQGLIGGYYAAAQGEDAEVAAAIRDHYKPVGQGDDVPTAPVTVAVSLADKLDTIAAFFANDDKPTGSKDPFALRRAALGVAATLERNRIRLPLNSPFSATYIPAIIGGRLDNFEQPHAKEAMRTDYMGAPFEFARNLLRAGNWQVDKIIADKRPSDEEIETLRLGAQLQYQSRIDDYIAHAEEFIDFFADRLKVQQREAGVRHDLIDAVFALGGEDDLVRLLARVRALQAFVDTDDGANLLAGYKRAANILKKEGYSPLPLGEGQGASAPRGEGDAAGGRPHPSDASRLPPSPGGRGNLLSYTPEPAESALIAALDAAEPAAASAVAAEDFEGAMTALSTLRAPIDAFFEGVTVNDPDPAKRDARLALLARVRNAVHTVADFSRIEG